MAKTRLSTAVILLASVLYVGTTHPSAAPQQQGGAAQPAAPQQGGAPQPAPPAGDAQQPTFRGGIDFVRVDVIVSDKKGQPVTDLKQSDFVVLEDGKPQKVEQFRVVKIDGNADAGEPVRQIRSTIDEETEAQRDDVRVFVIFLDDYHVRDNNAIAARAPLVKFVETQLRPNDMVAIMYPLTPVADVVFTRNHESIVNAIRNFEGRKYDYRPRNIFERNYERESTDTIERIRNQVVIGALEGLSVRLGGVRDGRKSVIFVSEGFMALLPPQMRRENAQSVQLVGGGASDPSVEGLAEMERQADIDSRMRDLYKAANRNNTAFYSLDPRGLAVFEFDIADGGATGVVNPDADRHTLTATQNTLRDLSTETDGRAIVNRNSLGEGLAQMVRDASYYYLIGFTTQSPNDGKFHDIKVQVKRSGIDVRARKGYWAVTPADIERITNPTRAPEAVKPVQQALATIATSVQAAKFVRTWIGTERGENGKTRVTLTWEPLPIQQGVRREQAGRVSLLAADPQGAVVFRGRSADASGGGAAAPAATPAGTAPAARTASPGSSLPQKFVFDAPPGKLELRLAIEAAGGGTLDNETRTVVVPDLTAPQASLSTPRVFRARNAREFQLLSADAAAVPVAGREFSRVERLLIRFDAYGPGSEKLVPAAALLSRTGQKIADVPVAPAAAGGAYQIDLGLNTMAAGEYVVEITLKDSAGQSATELVPLRIGT